ncbi:hypothetical protein EST38_g8791 [Candolleomyces aberdarensis]|uniref:Uncharacterized protein n=1 Tax=Candolleomyces aberdarensis TaxID=2316362 RepID=A0A4Q2DEH8_9AGAR|nr:hypothetical protein EST38_g8791 [Candolleomyces aberdarensis]
MIIKIITLTLCGVGDRTQYHLSGLQTSTELYDTSSNYYAIDARLKFSQGTSNTYPSSEK